MVHPIHQRMAELWSESKNRVLSDQEEMEMLHCLKANTELCYKLAHLKNLSLIASTIGDTAWQHEICAEIEAIEHSMP